MDPFRDPPPAADSMAAARLHVQALTECGLSRETLLRALLEDVDMGRRQPADAHPRSRAAAAAATADARRSLSSRSSGSTRASVLTAATSDPSLDSASALSLSVPSTPLQPPPPRRPPAAKPLPTPRPATATTTTTTTTTTTNNNNKTTPSPPAHPTTRAYWCTFCDTKFQRKFDWKRHEAEFHERELKYPCPSCNRVFWAPHSFNAHHRAAHPAPPPSSSSSSSAAGSPAAPPPPSAAAVAVAPAPHRRKRAWGCGFCAALLASRDAFLDHVGAHYEAGGTKAHWNHANAIYGLLHQPPVWAAWRALVAARFPGALAGRRARFTWEPARTGRVQGFLEGEAPGGLQDRLEFFCARRPDGRPADDPVALARWALDLALVRFGDDRTALLPPPPPLPGSGYGAGLADATAGARRPVSEPVAGRAGAGEPAARHLSAPLLRGRGASDAITRPSQFAMAPPTPPSSSRASGHGYRYRNSLVSIFSSTTAPSALPSPLSPSSADPGPGAAGFFPPRPFALCASAFDAHAAQTMMDAGGGGGGLYPQTIPEVPEHAGFFRVMDMDMDAAMGGGGGGPVPGMTRETGGALPPDGGGGRHGAAPPPASPPPQQQPAAPMSVDWSRLSAAVVDEAFAVTEAAWLAGSGMGGRP